MGSCDANLADDRPGLGAAATRCRCHRRQGAHADDQRASTNAHSSLRATRSHRSRIHYVTSTCFEGPDEPTDMRANTTTGNERSSIAHPNSPHFVTDEFRRDPRAPTTPMPTPLTGASYRILILACFMLHPTESYVRPRHAAIALRRGAGRVRRGNVWAKTHEGLGSLGPNSCGRSD